MRRGRMVSKWLQQRIDAASKEIDRWPEWKKRELEQETKDMGKTSSDGALPPGGQGNKSRE
jgi:hypothetical protein